MCWTTLGGRYTPCSSGLPRYHSPAPACPVTASEDQHRQTPGGSVPLSGVSSRPSAATIADTSRRDARHGPASTRPRYGNLSGGSGLVSCLTPPTRIDTSHRRSGPEECIRHRGPVGLTCPTPVSPCHDGTPPESTRDYSPTRLSRIAVSPYRFDTPV